MKLKTFSRIKALQHLLASWKVQACLIENPIDVFYLTGIHFSLATLFVTQDDAMIFVDGRYIESAKTNLKIKVGTLDEKKIARFLSEEKITTFGFDMETTTHQRFLQIKKWGKATPLNAPLRSLRLIKDEQECRALKISAALLWKGFKFLPKLLNVGISEIELARQIEIYFLSNGAKKMGFSTIVAFGSHSSLPHHHPSKRKLKKGDLILIDMGVVVGDYHSDMTRVLFFGDPEPKLREIYQVVYESQAAALKLCRPGTSLGELDKVARNVMKKSKLEKNYLHSLGHGVGLEIHEAPRISYKGKDKNEVLKPGMVITIEPGLYLPGIGGVRYEDTVIITKNGCENFYPRTPLKQAILDV